MRALLAFLAGAAIALAMTGAAVAEERWAVGVTGAVSNPDSNVLVDAATGLPLGTPSNPLNTTPAAGAVASSATNSSSTITTGGTFQTISAASTSRKSLDFVNICNVAGNCTGTSNYCYVFIAASGTPTTANSIPVAAGQEYLRSTGAIPSNAIQATCAGTGDKFFLTTQ